MSPVTTPFSTLYFNYLFTVCLFQTLSSFERKIFALLKCTLPIREVYQEFVELLNSFKTVNTIKAQLTSQKKSFNIRNLILESNIKTSESSDQEVIIILEHNMFLHQRLS